MARVRNISISRVTVEDVDPRYPILIAGLVDHPIENVTISDVSVQYRGGLKMEHAVEQRQINQPYAYTAYQAAPANQSLPWLVNTFFAKNEALLPRVSWNPSAGNGAGAWAADPTTSRRCRASIPSRATSACCRPTACTRGTSEA